MSEAVDFRALVRDLRAAGIPYEPDLSFPCPVRHQTALYVAIGHLCERCERPGQIAANRLRRRAIDAVRRVQDIGRRSRFAGWFSPAPEGARQG